MNDSLVAYYKERANEYDKVYQIPNEQEDLQKATKLFQNIFANKSVLEIACGTGYWTTQISRTATSVYATDINKEVINIAQTKISNHNVTFEIADMYNLNITQRFNGLFGGFIWSHILVQDIDKLLSSLANKISDNCEIVFIDSKQIEGTTHDKKRITRVDEFGNTFQTRKLENGTTYEVLKNFPSNDFLLEKLNQIATNIKLIDLEYYWIATCKYKAK